MVTSAFAVEGLTCGSCLAEVLEHVHAVPGVRGAAVDLVVGGPSPVVVTSGAPISAERIRAAVERAGFSVQVDHRHAPDHRGVREELLAARVVDLDRSTLLGDVP